MPEGNTQGNGWIEFGRWPIHSWERPFAIALLHWFPDRFEPNHDGDAKERHRTPRQIIEGEFGGILSANVLNAVIGNIEDNAESLYYAARPDRLEHGTNVHDAEEGVVHALEILDRISEGRGDSSQMLENVAVVRNMAASVAKAIAEELPKWARPNDDSQGVYDDYVSVHIRVADTLCEIVIAIDKLPNAHPERDASFRDLRAKLQKDVLQWALQNSDKVVNLGFNTGLISAVCAVLGALGVSPSIAFVFSVLQLSGASLKESLEKMKGMLGLKKRD